MPPEHAKYLRDMLDALGAIERRVSGRTSNDFLQDSDMRDAVQWNFCVIGEALSQLAAKDQATTSRITGYRKIIGFRNQLIHGYGVINSDITWNIITTKLPILRRELEGLLAE